MLSLCMIVKNEEPVLARCLASARDVADEIVVVDTGSADGTVAVARDFGAVVIHHDFADLDFGRARNRALDAARGDLALVLDADEELCAGSASVIRRLASGPADAGYLATRHNHDPSGPRRTGDDHAVRLFPLRPWIRYRERVHETIDASILAAGGRLCRSAIEIDHHLPGAERQREKGRFYLSLLRRDLATDPDNVDRLTFLAAELHRLGDFAAATRVAERLAALLPDDHEAHLMVALYHHAFGGDKDQAKASVRAALRLRPGDREASALWQELRAA